MTINYEIDVTHLLKASSKIVYGLHVELIILSKFHSNKIPALLDTVMDILYNRDYKINYENLFNFLSNLEVFLYKKTCVLDKELMSIQVDKLYKVNNKYMINVTYTYI